MAKTKEDILAYVMSCHCSDGGEDDTYQQQYDKLRDHAEANPDDSYFGDEIGVTPWEPFEDYTALAFLKVIEDAYASLCRFLEVQP